MCFWNSLAFSMTQWMLAIWSLVPLPFLNPASTSEWLHWLSGHESKQTLGDGEGQGSLACCSPWGRRESDTTERLTEQQRRLQLESSLVFVDQKKREQSAGKVEEALQNEWLKRQHVHQSFSPVRPNGTWPFADPKAPGAQGGPPRPWSSGRRCVRRRRERGPEFWGAERKEHSHGGCLHQTALTASPGTLWHSLPGLPAPRVFCAHARDGRSVSSPCSLTFTDALACKSQQLPCV